MSSSFLSRVNLSQSFQFDYQHDSLLYYYSLPRQRNLNDYDEFTEKCFELLLNRKPFTELQKECNKDSISCYSPNDASIFKVRFNMIASNNEAYTIAAKDNPTIAEIEKLASLHPSWAWLFPIKTYLHHHKDKAKQYRGLLPFGKYVIAFYNGIKDVDGEKFEKINGQPTLQHHMSLQNISNAMADLDGVPTITINDKMYLYGGKMYNTAND